MVNSLSWRGSEAERLVNNELLRRGHREGETYYYQAPFFGFGTGERGSYSLDFLFIDPPGLAFNVQGVYWHYGQGTSTEANDVLLRAQLAQHDITLIFVDEDDVLEDVRWIVGEALQFRDHSRLG